MAVTAITALSRQARRAGLMTAAIAGAVALSAGLGNFLPATRAGLTRSVGQLAAGRVYVNSVPPNNSFAIDSKLGEDVVATLRARPDVSRVDRNYYLGVDDGSARFAIVAYESLTRDFTVYRGMSSRAAIARNEYMIGSGLARSRRLHPGDSLTIPTASGPVVRRVGGVWASPTNQGQSVTVSPGVFTTLFGEQPPQAVFVSPAGGLSAGALAVRLRADKDYAGLHVLTSGQYVTAVADDIGRYLQPFWVLQRLFLLLALVSTVTTLVLAAVQTTRERAVLSAVGVGPRALYRMVVVEGTAVGAIGALLGVIGAALLTVSLSMVAGILFGLRPPIRFAPVSLASSALLAIVVVALGTLGPAALSARTSPVEGLRYE
jgi:hypothetical protein